MATKYDGIILPEPPNLQGLSNEEMLRAQSVFNEELRRQLEELLRILKT